MEKKKYYFEDLTIEKVGIGTAHSKIILMGEHAVVYDYPAIALPFPAVNVRAQVSILPNSTTDYLTCRYYTGDLDQAPEKLANIKKACQLASQQIGSGHSLNLSIESTIPAGRGMGSSAAVCVALVRAIFNLYDQEIGDDLLYYIVNEAEVIAHGSTSGLDTLMTSSDYAHIYRKSQQPVSFELDLPAYLVVADSGKAGQTSQAVGQVAELMDKKHDIARNAMDSIGKFVEEAYISIHNKDINKLGRLMSYNHYYLNQLGVSTPRLDKIVNSAWLAGALGAKLTGGGLGGCLIALTDSKKSAQRVSHAMEEAGAFQTWSINLAKK